MSIIYCPECGHEVSNAAVACPNCGRPLQAQPVVRDRVVPAAVVTREERKLPPWAFVPIILLGAAVLLFLFLMLGRDDDELANRNVKIGVETGRSTSNPASTDRTSTQTISPPAVTDVAPGTDTTSTVSVPGSQTIAEPPPSEGKVTIYAKVATSSGSTQAVRNEKFYLLDKDLESILNEAGLEPIEGQTLTNSLGLSVLYPDRYGAFNRDALRAIKQHIKYSGTTDGSGKAQLGGVKPDSYYLFGVTKTGRGFAVWSSPVSVNPGDNLLNLSPQRITEAQNNSE